MKKILFFLIITSSFAFSQYENRGMAFLKLGFDSRNSAMGNSGSTFSKDVTALYYNPSLLADIQNAELIFTHNQWIQDVRSEMFGAFARVNNIPLAIGINTTQISDIEVRSVPGDVESTFNANYFAASLSSALKVVDDLSFGFTLKYLYENLLSDEAMGVGYDLGLNYELPYDGINAAASIRNLGSMNTFRNQKTELPENFTLGLAYLRNIENLRSDILISAEFQNYNKSGESSFNFGGEIFYGDIIALRLGYRLNEFESRDISLGLGLKWNKFYFDYAYIPFLNSLGNSNIISLKIKFN